MDFYFPPIYAPRNLVPNVTTAVVLQDGRDCKGGSQAKWEAGKPPDMAVSCFLISTCVFAAIKGLWKPGELPAVKAGLRAFAEHRETQERSTVCSHPTSLI